jgi:CRISPR-associated protein Csm2
MVKYGSESNNRSQSSSGGYNSSRSTQQRNGSSGGYSGGDNKPLKSSNMEQEEQKAKVKISGKNEEELGKLFVNEEITTSQIRKFLSAVNTIENNVTTNSNWGDENDLKKVHFLNVKLAYQVGRDKKLMPFYCALKDKINGVKDKITFNDFARFVESIVSYHKYYGGKD